MSYEEIRMLFEADMQQFFNSDDKRKSNLYKAVLGRSLRKIIWKDIASQVGTTTAYCKKYWLDSLKAKYGRGKLAKEADEVNVLMRGVLTKLLEEHVLIEKRAERESLIGKDVVIG